MTSVLYIIKYILIYYVVLSDKTFMYDHDLHYDRASFVFYDLVFFFEKKCIRKTLILAKTRINLLEQCLLYHNNMVLVNMGKYYLFKLKLFLMTS